MGFDWVANVRVVFGVEIAIPEHTIRLAKRLAEWRPCDGTLFSLAAKRVRDQEEVPETVRKRAKLASKVACDYATIDSDDEEALQWSDGPDDVDDATTAFLANLRKYTTVSFEGDEPSHHRECSFDLEFNEPELINEAFQLAIERLLGQDSDGGLCLEFATGGAHGEAEDGATERVMMLVYKPVETAPSGGLDTCRGGVGGVPWGCMVTQIPTGLDMRKEEKMIKKVMKAFGFRPATRFGMPSNIGWHLFSVSSGG